MGVEQQLKSAMKNYNSYYKQMDLLRLLLTSKASEKAKEITKTIKDLGLKVQPRIEGDAVRVVAKQIDDLQAVIQTLKAKDFGVPIQAENYR